MINLKAAIHSWKTTAAAVLAAMAAVGMFGHEWITTGAVPDANAMVDAIVLAAISLGLFAARDADKSSQDSGVRP